MQIELNRDTWYSKLISLIIVCGVIPIVVFFIGREYQKTISVYSEENQAAVTNYASNDHVFSRYESTSSPVVYKSGVKGTIMVGPTCPVARNTSDPQCADQPLAIRIKFIDENGSATTTVSSADGSFSIMLPPGKYAIVSAGNGVLPSLAPINVTVDQGRYSTMQLSFDSGIR